MAPRDRLPSAPKKRPLISRMDASPHIMKPLFVNIFDVLAGGPYEPERRIFIKDPRGHYVYVNERFAKDAGMPPERLLGSCDEITPWAANAESCRAGDRAVMAAGREPMQTEFRAVAGRRLRVLRRKIALYSPDGKPAGIVGTYVPVPQRRVIAKDRTQHALNVALSLLSALQMASFEEQMEAWDSDAQPDAGAPEPQLF